MSEEKREILEHLVEYLQQKIDSGEHKIFFNDLMWDEKTIDCINAINNTLEEIERLNNIIKEAIEYIKKHGDYNKLSGCIEELDLYKINELLDILKGSDKE